MPLSQMQDFTFKHSAQQDAAYTQYTATQIKTLFDSRGDEIRAALNLLITALTSTDGASDIGTNTIQDVDGTTIQAMLQSVRDKLKSVADGSSGADYVNATAITGLTGSTVQTILEALKTYVDTADSTNINNLITHKTSVDHDTRYFTKTELQSVATGSSGADQIKATPVAVGSGNTVQSQLAWLLSQIAIAATGSIPDGTLTEAKLAQALVDKINTALSNSGVLPTLLTVDKSSTVNAINEVKQDTDAHKAENVSQFSSVNARLTLAAREILRMKMRQTGLNLDPNAWSDSLEDTTGINTGLSNGYTFDSVNKSLKVGQMPSANKISQYSFDDTPNDSSGNGNNLTLVGSPTYATGKIGNALSLNGTSQYARLDSLATYFKATSSFTISFWLKTSSANGALVQTQLEPSANDTRVFISLTSGKLNFVRVLNANYDDVVATVNTYNDDLWHFVTCTFDGANMKIYVDNVEAVTKASTKSLTGIGANFSIGASISGTGAVSSHTSCLIDNFIIYNQALTAQEVLNFYAYITNGCYIVWNPQTSEGIFAKAVIEALAILGTGTITYEISRDGGTTFTPCTLDTVTDISAQPSGTSIVLKATITGNAELLSVAWGGSV